MHRMSQSKQLWPVGCMSLEESTCMWMLSLFVLIFRRRVSYWLIISHCRRSWRNRVVTDTSRRCVCVLCCSVVLYTCRLLFICILMVSLLSPSFFSSSPLSLPPPFSFPSFLSLSLCRYTLSNWRLNSLKRENGSLLWKKMLNWSKSKFNTVHRVTRMTVRGGQL